MSRLVRVSSFVAIALATTGGGAAATPYPVSQPYDSGWQGKTFRLADFPGFQQALQNIRNLFNVPELGRIVDVDATADLHGYVRYWMAPSDIGARAELTAWINSELRVLGAPAANANRWIRASVEARTWDTPEPGPNDPYCMACPDWGAGVVYEVLDHGAVVLSQWKQTDASGEVTFQERPTVIPLSETRQLHIGVLGDIAVSVSASVSADLDATAKVTPGAGGRVRSHNSISAGTGAYAWYWTPAGYAELNFEFEPLPYEKFEGSTIGDLDVTVGEVRFNTSNASDPHLEACGKARAELGIWNPFSGWIYAQAYAAGAGHLFEPVNETFGTWKFLHDVIQPVDGCQRILSAP